MGQLLEQNWSALMDGSRNPLRHLDLASQHYFMQVLGWMWSMIFSLTFLSIFHFGIMWIAHVAVIGGIAMTVGLFREAEQRKAALVPASTDFSHASSCIWKLENEA